MPFHIGWPELLLFAGVVLLLFGSRLPSVMRSLGQSVTEFKKGTKDAEKELDGPPPAKDPS
jgi:sec-independent protein translocase protein TatA